MDLVVRHWKLKHADVTVHIQLSDSIYLLNLFISGLNPDTWGLDVDFIAYSYITVFEMIDGVAPLSNAARNLMRLT